MEESTLEDTFRDNYSSVSLLLPQVEAALEEQAEKGQLLKKPLAQAQLDHGPGLTIASLGALQKSVGDDGVIAIRLLYDGTHGVEINRRIRVRDQDACPAAPEPSGRLCRWPPGRLCWWPPGRLCWWPP